MIDPICADEDLVWYFQNAQAEIGESSTFGAMVSGSISRSSCANVSGPSERQCRAAARQVRIRQALRAISPRLQAVLEAAYSPRHSGCELVLGLVLRVNLAQRALEATPEMRAASGLHGLAYLSGGRRKPAAWSAFAASDLSGTADETRARVLELASELLVQAHAAYREARNELVKLRGPRARDKAANVRPLASRRSLEPAPLSRRPAAA